MKRSRIVTFKVKETPKDKKTKSSYKTGDYFTVDFDKCITDLENDGRIYVPIDHGKSVVFYSNEVYIIRVMYIDKYDSDPENEIKEFEKFLNI